MAKRCVRPAIHSTEARSNTSLGSTVVAVPLSRLADIIEDSKAHAASLGLKACVKGHIGDSKFQENITYNKTDSKEAEKATVAVKTMVKRALEMEGTCTGEHGVGIGKKDALLQEVGEDTIQVMVSRVVRSNFELHR